MKCLIFLVLFLFSYLDGFSQESDYVSFLVKYTKVSKTKKNIDNESTCLILENTESSNIYDVSILNKKYKFYYLETDKGHVSQICCSDTSIVGMRQPIFTDKYLGEDIFKNKKGFCVLNKESDSLTLYVNIYSFKDNSNYCRCTSEYARMFDFKSTDKFAHIIRPISFIRLSRKQKKEFSSKIKEIISKFQKEYGLH